jgi:isopentenyl-diphosphate delta-isomerase
MDSLPKDNDVNSENRKADHISLAFRSQVKLRELDSRFSYEPFLAAHPDNSPVPFSFAGKKMNYPIWVSSMTGGTEKANKINKNLAKICGEFGFGMGLGSCRSILFDNTRLDDFAVRNEIGDDFPLYANIGIAQADALCRENSLEKIYELLSKTKTDGIILHVNPMQEWLQPEGDRFLRPPLETIAEICAWAKGNLRIIVKEVGQGFGKESMRALMQLPLQAIDFAASGGTNFALLEILRSSAEDAEMYKAFTQIGHSATEMVNFANELCEELQEKAVCKEIIVSGGIATCLDGFYCIEKLTLPAVFGQASQFLKYAEDIEKLRVFARAQAESYRTAKAFLKVKS